MSLRAKIIVLVGIDCTHIENPENLIEDKNLELLTSSLEDDEDKNLIFLGKIVKESFTDEEIIADDLDMNFIQEQIQILEKYFISKGIENPVKLFLITDTI